MGFAPPKSPASGGGFAPPKSPSSAPAGFAPPKHGNLGMGPGASAARPVAPAGAARPSVPFGGGTGAARPTASGDSWKALAGGMEQKGTAHGGARNQSLDIKRSGFPPTQTP